MNLLDLQHIERAFDKAKTAGPQALHDWAVSHAPALFARLRPEIDGSKADPLAPLRPLFPSVPDVAKAAADDITSLRAERAKAKGTVSYIDGMTATMDQLAPQQRALISTLRPFAAFGAPIVQEQLDIIREASGVDPAYVFAVMDASGGALLAGVTAEQCIAAHDLINQIDGGGGT